jgi:hypothetical protein
LSGVHKYLARGRNQWHAAVNVALCPRVPKLAEVFAVRTFCRLRRLFHRTAAAHCDAFSLGRPLNAQNDSTAHMQFSCQILNESWERMNKCRRDIKRKNSVDSFDLGHIDGQAMGNGQVASFCTSVPFSRHGNCQQVMDVC